MDKFWVTMIINERAKLSDIKSKSRKEKVVKILLEYVAEKKITQEQYDAIISAE